MTLLTSLARVEAAAAGRAKRIRTVRHVHLSDRPLMVIPLQLAGEACAPLAAMVGDDPDKPRLLTVYEPRDRASGSSSPPTWPTSSSATLTATSRPSARRGRRR